MKVYFTGSSANLADFKQTYERIDELLRRWGYEVCDTPYKFYDMSVEDIAQKDEANHFLVYRTWNDMVSKVDIAIVESSFPGTINLGGVIVGLLERGVPTLCLYRQGMRSVFINEIFYKRILFAEYNKETLESVLSWNLEELKNSINKRFTFFLSGKIESYLEEISAKKGLSKSEIIRGLIEKEMK